MCLAMEDLNQNFKTKMENLERIVLVKVDLPNYFKVFIEDISKIISIFSPFLQDSFPE